VIKLQKQDYYLRLPEKMRCKAVSLSPLGFLSSAWKYEDAKRYYIYYNVRVLLRSAVMFTKRKVANLQIPVMVGASGRFHTNLLRITWSVVTIKPSTTWSGITQNSEMTTVMI
jgi:hypothetical protein